MPKETRPEKIRQRKNKYLLTRFNITLDRQEEMVREQAGLCLICGGRLDAHGPANTDHFHFKVKAFRHSPRVESEWKWYAQAYDELGQVRFVAHADTKTRAIAAVKAMALPWAVRGMLCAKCNRGLGYVERFFDAAAHPENLDPVRFYLSNRLRKTAVST